MTAAAREWLAAHLPWIVVGLLGFWLPPAVYAVAVYRGWSDPVTIATVAELACMSAALPGLFHRRAAAWRLLVWSRLVVFVQTLWVVLLNSRLTGLGATLETKPVVEAVLGLAVASYVLVHIRGLYR
jgi:hypothetical protein